MDAQEQNNQPVASSPVDSPSVESPPVESPPVESPPVESMSFEDALGELERLVKALEGGTVMLDKAVAYYERGMQLSKHCQKQLADAKGRIDKVRLESGKAVGLESFTSEPSS
ncbi:MAG: exodeoxyribonuclease VII small subunit [Alphaproteobacteria bacterium GM7ARS4]|nr:exodeoxyribonuclease VII small subunit [Alphaproteobacteria bacterium GM7ARS4]